MVGGCQEIIEEREIPKVECLIAGFPGNGLIGGIASEQLINSLKLEQVASLVCEDIPPTAVIFDGIPRRPIRFFANDRFLLVKSDMVIPPNLTFIITEMIMDWVIEKGIKEIIVFDGIPQNEDSEENKIWGVVSQHAIKEDLDKLGIEIIRRGAIAGISSSLMLESFERGIRAIGLYAEGTANIPDPKASARILEKLSEYKDIKIDTEKLVESAEEFEKEFEKLINQTNEAQSDMEGRSAHPPLYG